MRTPHAPSRILRSTPLGVLLSLACVPAASLREDGGGAPGIGGSPGGNLVVSSGTGGLGGAGGRPELAPDPRRIVDQALACELGAVVDAEDDLGAITPLLQRGFDGALLMARRPRSSALPSAPDGAQAWPGPEAPMPCGPAAHAAFEGFALDDREITVSCGGTADAPRTTEAVPSWDAAWAAVGACADDAWVWLWTPRTCAQLPAPTRRGDDIHRLAPDVTTTRRTDVACLVDETGAWTRLFGAEGAADAMEAMDLVPTGDLLEGLARASRREGGAAPTALVHVPPERGFFRFRLRCERPGGGLDIATRGAAVARGLIEPDRYEYFTPSSLGSFDDLLETASVADQAAVWGRRTAPFQDGWPHSFCYEDCVEDRWTARWDLRGDNALLEGAIGVAPVEDPAPSGFGSKGTWFRLTQEHRNCSDGIYDSAFGNDAWVESGIWEIYVR